MKPKIDRRKDRPHSKVPVTINSLLAKDSVKHIIAEIIANQADIEELLCIYVAKGDVQVTCSIDMPCATAVFRLEQAKQVFMGGE